MVNFRSIIKRETDLLDKIAESLPPADNSLLIGSIDFEPLLLKLNTRYHYRCDDHLPYHQRMDVCLAHHHELPFEPNSMNIILLPHTLEQTDKPALVLEEVVSTLAPNGYLILLNTKKYPIAELALNKQPLMILSAQHFSLPFSGLKEPWEGYAERCLPFLCQAYLLVTQKSPALSYHQMTTSRNTVFYSPAYRYLVDHEKKKFQTAELFLPHE